MAVSNKLTLSAGAVDTGEVVDLEAMLSYMKLEYDFDGTFVLVKSVARNLIKGYSGRLKESAIRGAVLEYAELFDSLCKDSDNSWLKLNFYVIRLRLDALLVERLLRDYLKRSKWHVSLLSKKGHSDLGSAPEGGGFQPQKGVLKHIYEARKNDYQLETGSEFFLLEKEIFRLRNKVQLKDLTYRLLLPPACHRLLLPIACPGSLLPIASSTRYSLRSVTSAYSFRRCIPSYIFQGLCSNYDFNFELFEPKDLMSPTLLPDTLISPTPLLASSTIPTSPMNPLFISKDILGMTKGSSEGSKTTARTFCTEKKTSDTVPLSDSSDDDTETEAEFDTQHPATFVEKTKSISIFNKIAQLKKNLKKKKLTIAIMLSICIIFLVINGYLTPLLIQVKYIIIALVRVIAPLLLGGEPAHCTSNNITHALFYRELSGRRLSPQGTLTTLPVLGPDHSMTGGRPLSLERTRREFANVPEADTRKSLLEIWEELAELHCLDGKLPSSETIYEIITSLRPTSLEPLWLALKIGLDLPLEINRDFLRGFTENDQAGLNMHNPIFNLPLSQRILISKIVLSIQDASGQLQLVFIKLVPELELFAWTLRRDLLQAEKKAIRLNPNEQARPCSFVPEHVHSFVPIRSFPFPNSLASWLVPTMEALRSQARD